MQELPLLGPQVPSVEVGPVGVDVGADEVADAAEEADPEDEEPPQFPKPAWHPVPQ